MSEGIHVDFANLPEGSEPVADLDETCPRCGGGLFFGYGLSGGGIGPWAQCIGKCGAFFKRPESDDGSTGGWYLVGVDTSEEEQDDE